MFRAMTTSTLALLALTAPALADLTPTDAWQAWVDYYKASGYTVTEGSRDEAGGALTLHDVTFAFAAPAGGGTAEMKVPQITLTPTGDGGVRTVYSDTASAKLDGKDENGDPVAAVASASAPGNETVSTGSPGDVTNKGIFPKFTVSVDSIRTKEGTLEKPLVATITNLTSSWHMLSGQPVKFTQQATAEKAELALAVKSDKDGKPMVVNGTLVMDGLSGDGTFDMPAGVNIGKDMAGAIKQGLAVQAKVAVASMSGRFDATGKDGDKDIKADGTFEAKGVAADVGLSRTGVNYQTDSDGLKVTMNSNNLPMPVSYSMDSASMGFQLPLSKGDAPQPFKLAYSLGGLTIGDAVWDMFDKDRKLPRDPANLDLDLTGMAKVNVDLFDPEAVKAMEEASHSAETGANASKSAPAAEPATPTEPFTPTEMAINKLALSAVGAKLDASGQLAFPSGKSDPVGHVKARFDGVNGLIDKLVALGALKAEEVGGYRMMLALIAKPAPEGGDALVSDIEVKEGGQVFANGQQVK